MLVSVRFLLRHRDLVLNLCNGTRQKLERFAANTAQWDTEFSLADDSAQVFQNKTRA